MRFTANGPDIPDLLIEARDQGEVVFFCGAGVSLPALPDFDGLTRRLLDGLGARESREAYDLSESLDRVFSKLVKEFGGGAVDRAIASALRAPRGVDLTRHKIVLDLSRDQSGVPRIVTTNFDRLFERAEPALTRYVPPVLPDLGVLEPLRGLVYLHGRLGDMPAHSRAGYIVSSADFGRAYLAEGWAARFVRALRERYAIVLLGYSANDPPMRYLLEGLSSREGAIYRQPIYAFAPERAPIDDEDWRDKGVTLIGYEPSDRAHSGLWNSLAAWADAARDRDGWRDRMVGLAHLSPRSLQPHERGQVASFVNTTAGAQAFLRADPSPSAEWLSVFDANERYAPTRQIAWDDNREIDPLQLYGIDDDPPRPEPKPGETIAPPGKDLLRWHDGDQCWNERLRVSGYYAAWTNQLPPRLAYLTAWVARVMDQPATIAWAAGNPMPHPALLLELRNRIEDADLPSQARLFWQCYFEAVRSLNEDGQDLRRYELATRVKKEGWSASVLREFERIVEPAFEIRRSILRRGIAADMDWATTSLYHLVDIDVRVSSWDDRLEIDDAALVPVVQILRRSLERSAQMLDESTNLIWRTPTLHPTGHRGETRYEGRKASHFLKFAKLFERLAAADREAARNELRAWDTNEPRFFAKLYLFAATLEDIIPPSQFAATILAMPDATFWEPNHQRELLFALRAQWTGLSRPERAHIERRIAKLAPPYDDDGEDDRVRRASRSASILRWLELQGKHLSPTAARQLDRLKSAGRCDWDDDWAWRADDSLGPWGGWVQRVTESQGLESKRPDEIVATARELSTDDHRELRDYRPFDGLVEKAPRKALAALRIAARRDEYPRDFWNSLVSNWPLTAGTRASLALAHTIARLPPEQFFGLRFETARFCEKIIAELPKADRAAALRAFDVIVDRFAAGEDSALGSGIHTTRNGRQVDRSEFSVMKSINAPAGVLTAALLKMLGPRKRRGPLPKAFAVRLDRLLTLPGDGAGHAACYIARQLSWLEYWHNDWAAKLLPRFALDDPIAPGLWHGVAADNHVLSLASEAVIKPAFLALLRGEANWKLEEQERRSLISKLVWMTIPSSGQGTISFAETRDILLAGSDDDRSQVLSSLINHEEEGIGKRVLTFVARAWPQQLRFQTGRTSSGFLQIIERAGDDFPEIVAALRSFLRPIDHLDVFVYRLKRDDPEGKNYASRFPDAMLDLLDLVVGGTTSHWGLSEILDRIVEAKPILRQDDRWRRLRALA